jgi:amino acid permease
MEKPAIDEKIPLNPQTSVHAADAPALADLVPPARTYAWWLVLGLVGLDCFSTLGYLPTLAVEGAKEMAPLAAVVVALLIVFAALPVYLYVVGRSPHGRGATGLLERHLSGWSGKLFLILFLGVVATDFVMTRTLSTADASKHLLANDHVRFGMDWLLQRKDIVHDALPNVLQGEWTDNVFAWWNEQLMASVVLMILGFALYFFLLRGFTRGFLIVACVLAAVFLAVNAVVIGSSLAFVARHSDYTTNWMRLASSTSYGASPLELLGDFAKLSLSYLPALVLGFSGFELSATCAPLVRGQSNDDPAQPRGRIRNARKLLIVTAVLMAVLVPTSVASVKFLVPPGAMLEGGAARDRALAYIAHGDVLQSPGEKVSITVPTEEVDDDPNAPNDDDFGDRRDEKPKALTKVEKTPQTTVTGTDVNPLFGPAFGTLYDLSAVLILFLAGASVTIGLRDLLPQYLTRYGMEMHWARNIGILLHAFNVIVLIVVIAFHASVSHQQGAYAVSVLILLAGAALAVLVDLSARKRASFFQSLALIPCALIGLIFLLLACWVSYESPAGLVIALLFVAVLLVSAGVSRWMRSTELRYYGFTFADEESGVRWEEIRWLEFQVLVPHRADRQALADKEAEIRARHRLAPEVPIIFIEAELGDPSDFQQHPLMQIVKQDGREIIRVSQCASIAHVLAAIALEFREIGRPPEMHFAWSEESPLTANLNFLLWGQGNIPLMVRALIRQAEPEPARQPRVVVG